MNRPASALCLDPVHVGSGLSPRPVEMTSVRDPGLDPRSRTCVAESRAYQAGQAGNSLPDSNEGVGTTEETRNWNAPLYREIVSSLTASSGTVG